MLLHDVKIKQPFPICFFYFLKLDLEDKRNASCTLI